jgi:NitT/TauT family transport system substrate-binding protein
MRGTTLRLFALITLLCLVFTPLWSAGRPESAESGAPESEAGETEAIAVSVVVPTGVPAITVASLASADPTIHDGYETSYEVVTSPDLMGARLLSGEADIAVVPTNLAARLYNQEQTVRLAGVVVWGILYVVSSEPLNGWEDLRGMEVGMLGRGLTPDIVFRHLAQANGLDPEEDLTLRYVNATTELAPNFLTGKVSASMMPEPMLTNVLKRKPDAVVAFDLQEEWAEASTAAAGRGYPQASLVVSSAFAAEHPEYVAAFISEFSSSVDAALRNPEEVSEQAASMMPQLSADIIASAMTRTNIGFVDAQLSRSAVEEYFQVLLESSPEALNGPLPDDDFYY